MPWISAAVPQIINFQGRLTDANNNPESGPFNMTFRIYDAGGNQLWTEDQTAGNGHAVSVSNGVFSVMLGSVQPIPQSVFSNPETYLEVKVGAETLSPRQRLVSAPYALNAASSEDSLKLGGLGAFDFVRIGAVDQNVGGVKTFSSFPVKSGGLSPSAPAEFTTKSYVDGLLGGGSNPTFASLTVSGNVGIGATGPTTRLHILSAADSLPATSGNTQTGYSVRLNHATGGGAVFDIGQTSGGTAWLQATNGGDLATNYNLLLSPNGGNVGIGTTSPWSGGSGRKLHVRTSADQNFVISGPQDLSAGISLQAFNDAVSANVPLEIRGAPVAFTIGNVGIGTIAPGAKLHVEGTTILNGQVQLAPGSVSAPAYSFYPAGTYGATGMLAPSANTVAFATSGGERVRIDSSGQVGIGTTGPVNPLHVAAGGADTYIGTIENLSTGVARFRVRNAAAQGAWEVDVQSDGSTLLQTGKSSSQPMNFAASSYGFQSGNVGIGTTGSGYKLDVAGTIHSGAGGIVLEDSATLLRFLDNAGAANGKRFQIQSFTGNLAIGATDDSWNWKQPSFAMYVRNDGNVGIGTTGPGNLLTVNQAGNATNSNPSTYGLMVNVAGANRVGLGGDAAGGIIQSWNSLPLQINPAGNNVGIGTTLPGFKLDVIGTIRGFGITDSSDLRLKKDVQPISNSLEKILSLRGVSYSWKNPEIDSARQIGLIAQEVEKAFPELVKMDGEGLKTLNYSHLAAPIIEAIKELKAENEQLKAKIAEIEKKLKN